MRALFSPTATTVADPTYALDVCIGRIPKLCFEGERSWKRGLGSSIEKFRVGPRLRRPVLYPYPGTLGYGKQFEQSVAAGRPVLKS